MVLYGNGKLKFSRNLRLNKYPLCIPYSYSSSLSVDILHKKKIELTNKASRLLGQKTLRTNYSERRLLNVTFWHIILSKGVGDYTILMTKEYIIRMNAY